MRGPWITGALLPRPTTRRSSTTAGCAPATSAPSTRNGFIQITDRAKDVIKSGGEWISSVELENDAHGAPRRRRGRGHRRARRALGRAAAGLRRAASEGASVDADELRDFLADRVARWWLPERWAFIDEVPKTSVGKFDKKVLRARYADGALRVVDLEGWDAGGQRPFAGGELTLLAYPVARL